MVTQFKRLFILGNLNIIITLLYYKYSLLNKLKQFFYYIHECTVYTCLHLARYELITVDPKHHVEVARDVNGSVRLGFG
jgi:hypothetical protein